MGAIVTSWPRLKAFERLGIIVKANWCEVFPMLCTVTDAKVDLDEEGMRVEVEGNIRWGGGLSCSARTAAVRRYLRQLNLNDSGTVGMSPPRSAL